MRCRVQWIGPDGRPTPDDRPAVGVVWLPERQQVVCGRTLTFAETQRFPICAAHAARLREPGMELWRFELVESAEVSHGSSKS